MALLEEIAALVQEPVEKRRGPYKTKCAMSRYSVVTVIKMPGHSEKQTFRIRDSQAKDPSNVLLGVVFSTRKEAQEVADRLNLIREHSN